MKKNKHSEHILPYRLYIGVAAALMVLTAVTVRVSFVHLGGWNAVVAVGIATIKALVVAFFFMHLLYDKKIHLFIFSIALIMVGIFITLTMFDTLRRADIYDYISKPINENAVIYEKSPADSTSKPVHQNHK